MIPNIPSRSNIENVPHQAVYQTIYNANYLQQDDFTIENQQLYSAESGRELCTEIDADKICWLHFVGINEPALLKQLLQPYHIHDLIIEDILNQKQRPKIEQYQNYLFIAARVFQYHGNKLQSDPVYMIIGDNLVLTFQNRPLGLFSQIRQEFSNSRQTIRAKSIANLTYLFIDRLVDDYFITLDQYNTRAEGIDKTLFQEKEGNKNLLARIHAMKRDAIRLRRTLLPMREVINEMQLGKFDLFGPDLYIYLRDAYDHTLQLVEFLDTSREMVMSMSDVYLSFQSNRLNQQMRMLTVVTIIFMPLTLLTGIYGMNFEYMPELHWHYGYFAVLGVMAALIIGMLVFFSRRKWL